MPRGGRLVSDAVERARHALADYEAACAARAGEYGAARACAEALYRLMGEIDAGVWLDTREMDALAEAGGVSIIPEGRSRMHRWEVWVNNGGPVTTHSTFADAVRAAREATGE